ncbi:hypothetical protein Tco_1377359 [Tanacetum coccineum]
MVAAATQTQETHVNMMRRKIGSMKNDRLVCMPLCSDFDAQLLLHLQAAAEVAITCFGQHHLRFDVDGMMVDENVSQGVIEHDDAIQHTEEISTKKSPQADDKK